MFSDVIKTDLVNLGLKEGDNVLVHASLRSLGNLSEAAKTVTNAFLEVLGGDGTLLMPALSYSSVTKESPSFDWEHTPSCVGGLSEYFRIHAGTIRSIHPTHSVCALGKQAGYFTESHFNDRTPVGENSPFFRLKEANGKVLFLGCGLKPNTSMHGVEELVIPPYLFGGEHEYTMRISSDKTIKKTYIPHGFGSYIQRYDRLLDVLDLEDYRIGKVLEAEAFLLDCQAFWKKGEKVLMQDPFYFVDKA